MTWSPAERAAAADLTALTYVNPFTPERLQLEHRLLGLPPPPAGQGWHLQGHGGGAHLAALAARAEALLAAAPAGGDPGLHEGIAIYVLYERFRARIDPLLGAGAEAPIPWWDDFAAQAGELLPQPLAQAGCAHLLACLIQIRRCFAAIHAQLVGASAPMVALRAACWGSVFGADLRRYRACLWERMRDFPTLVTGPSGSGKELVAQAVGASAYIAVDPRRGRLAGGAGQAFLPLAISALSPALVEAELFGHRRGAFTGAVEERAGWLEVCPAHGCVFLDELGEIDPAVQVKLLRVLQTRRFSRVGEHAERSFRGRLVAATNRDLAAEIAAGRFRADVYYRLCADHIRTPALRELLAADPGELDRLCQAAAGRIVGSALAAEVAGESAAWIRRELGDAYPWPGNVRELEQCMRSLLLRGAYRPQAAAAAGADLAEAVRAGSLGAEELLDRYCAQVAAGGGGWREAARRLGMDWRTVRSRALRRGGLRS
ncbi:MAG: sigma 54-interacting transcriptional regulator [Planctomycetes bacterium]|nr:sigma 54-interacting transcriptional regulator [Planctomycetota bacterium]